MTNERTAGGAPLDPNEIALLAALRARGLNELAEMARHCFGDACGHAATALRELSSAFRPSFSSVVGAGGAGGGSGQAYASHPFGGIGGGGGGSISGEGVASGSNGAASFGGVGGGGGGTLYATPTGSNDPFVVAAQRLSEQQRQRAELHVNSLADRARAEFSGKRLVSETIEEWYRERGVIVRAYICQPDQRDAAIEPIRTTLDDFENTRAARSIIGGGSGGFFASTGSGGNGGYVGDPGPLREITGAAGVQSDPFLPAAQRLVEEQRRLAAERVAQLRPAAEEYFSRVRSVGRTAQLVRSWFLGQGVEVAVTIMNDDFVLDPIKLRESQ